MSELDSLAGRKMFQPTAPKPWGGGEWPITLGRGGSLPWPPPLTFHRGPPSLPCPRSPRRSSARSPSLKIIFWSSCHSVCLMSPQGFELRALVWNSIFIYFSVFLLPNDRVWWGNVFWQSGPRFESLKVENIENLKSQCSIFFKWSYVDSDVFLVLIPRVTMLSLSPLQNYN